MIAPTHAAFGAPTTGLAGERYAQLAQQGFALSHFAGREVVPAQYDGVAYVGHTACRANNDTCMGPRAKGTEYCIGHLRTLVKAGKMDPEVLAK